MTDEILDFIGYSDIGLPLGTNIFSPPLSRFARRRAPSFYSVRPVAVRAILFLSAQLQPKIFCTSLSKSKFRLYVLQ